MNEMKSKLSVPVKSRAELQAAGVAKPRVTTDTPQTAIFCIDTSGSMSGQPIADAAGALAEALRILADPKYPGFHAGVVSYQSHAHVLAPVQPAGSLVVPSFTTDGQTNITAALEVAKPLLTTPVPGAAPLRPVLFLMSDGVHNSGAEPSDALIAELHGIADCITIAYGSGFNAALLQRIASKPDFFRTAATGAEIRGFLAAIAATVTKSRLAGQSLSASGLSPFATRIR